MAFVITHNGRKIPLRLRYNPRAKRIILRVDPEFDGALITLPPSASEEDAFALVHKNADWLIRQIQALPPRTKLAEGQILNLLGMHLSIRHCPELRTGVQLIGSEIIVSGKPEHLPRRTFDWLKKYARENISPRAHGMAFQVKRKINRIYVRDTKSRWGSCSRHANLSFCWRLIMTPEWVLNYVVAHEVSHLVHMHHGPEFWSTVRSFDTEPNRARNWLKKNGDSLRRVEIGLV